MTRDRIEAGKRYGNLVAEKGKEEERSWTRFAEEMFVEEKICILAVARRGISDDA